MDRLGMITFQRCQALAHAGPGCESTEASRLRLFAIIGCSGNPEIRHERYGAIIELKSAAAMTTAADLLHSQPFASGTAT